MGNHAIVMVALDATHGIGRDPEFGRNLVRAMCAWPPPKDGQRRTSTIIGAGGFYPAARVLSRDHSTGVQLVWAHEGLGAPLNFDTKTVPPDVEGRLVELVRSLGYSVRKTRRKQP